MQNLTVGDAGSTSAVVASAGSYGDREARDYCVRRSSENGMTGAEPLQRACDACPPLDRAPLIARLVGWHPIDLKASAVMTLNFAIQLADNRFELVLIS